MDGKEFRVKTFKGDFYYFLNKIKNNENFSLSRWGDGELKILEGEYINLTNIKNGEFMYDPNNDKYKLIRKKIIESYLAKDDQYYIGIACRCCVGEDKHFYMKEKSKQNENNLTWANIFVNSNYKLFMTDFLNEMKNRDIVMVVNNKADISRLPFKIEKTYYVGVDAWLNDYNILYKIKQDYKDKKDKIFLFAAGPLSNILTYELWFNMNKNNTYIDIGSTLDVQMGMRPTRNYLRGGNTLNKICVW